MIIRSAIILLLAAVGIRGANVQQFETVPSGQTIRTASGSYFLGQGTIYARGVGDDAIEVLRSGQVTFEGRGRAKIAVEHFGRVTVGNGGTVSVRDGRLVLTAGPSEVKYDLKLGSGRLQPGYRLIATDRLRIIPPKRLEYFNPLNTSAVIENHTDAAIDALVFGTRGDRTDRVMIHVAPHATAETFWRSPTRIGIDQLSCSGPEKPPESLRLTPDQGPYYTVDGVQAWTRIRLVVARATKGLHIRAEREPLARGDIPKRTKQWGRAQERFDAQVVIGNDSPYTIEATLYAIGVYRQGREHAEPLALPPRSDYGPRDLFSPSLIVVGDPVTESMLPQPTVRLLDEQGREVGRRPGIRLENPPANRTTYLTFAGDDCRLKVEHVELFDGSLYRVDPDQVSE